MPMTVTTSAALILLAWSAPPAAAISPAPARILTDQSSNSVTKLRVGEPVEIRLAAQPGTGFSWAPTRSTPMLTLMAPLKPATMLPGGTQMQRYRFKSNRPGTFVVAFTYGQPWKGGTKRAKTRSFTLAVR